MTMTADARLPVRALVGTIVFVAVLPATAIVLVPYWLSGWHLAPPFLGTFLGLQVTRWLGVAMVVAALPLFLSFLGRFVFEGRGTPAPIAPTERLVVGGPFRWVRNPGYVAVVALVVGQGLIFASPAILLYAAAIALAFHVFVLLYEEPTLRATYGAEYDAYCKAVPRWIPRRPPAR
jgi:protein-S-isoprenylcysteine O-methyltransferase Ste14